MVEINMQISGEMSGQGYRQRVFFEGIALKYCPTRPLKLLALKILPPPPQSACTQFFAPPP